MCRTISFSLGELVDHINPFESPKSDLAERSKPPVLTPIQAEAWHEGDLLVVTPRAVLPNRCVKCNAPATKRVERTYTWHTPLLYLLIFVGVLIYVIVALIVRKSVKIDFALCDECHSKRQKSIYVGLAALLGSGLLIGLSIFLSSHSEAFLLGIPVAFIAFLIAALVINSATAVLKPKEIDDHFGRLTKAGPAFLDSLPPMR